MKLGIVGLPNVGKSTLFNALTKGSAESASYPFSTKAPNVGIVGVPDERLDELEKLYKSKKKVPAFIEFVDIAGLVRGASKGEGMGNQFLSHIREVDATLHVVRCFEDGNVSHVDESLDSLRDIETIHLELILADLEAVERKLAKSSKALKADKMLQKEVDLLLKLKAEFEEGRCARHIHLSDEEKVLAEEFNLLTFKPVLYAANVAEEDLQDDGASNVHATKLREFAEEEGSMVFVVCAQIEAEIAQLDEEEKNVFLSEMGMGQSGLQRLIAAGYELLGLISYLTAGEKEVRAWTIVKGTKAPQAAGKIHSDFERGFIRAETVQYNDLMAAGTYAQAKEKGLVRLEGKEYVVKEGDIILFRFNV